MIADDLAIDVKTAALLSSAYTFPYALVQPALGVTGDFFGKTRLMNLCLLVIALSALVCAVATSFSLLVATAQTSADNAITNRHRFISRVLPKKSPVTPNA